MSKSARILGCRAGAVGFAAALALMAPHVARAATSECPTREATLSAISALLGQSSARPEDLAEIEIADFGSRFSITVKGRTREYPEPARNCAQRARMAAVFVALTLAPPDVGDSNDQAVTAEPPSGTEASPEPSVAPSAAAQAPSPAEAPKPTMPATTPSEWYAEFDLGAQLVVDLARPTIDWGVVGRAVLSRAHWGMALGLDLPTRISFELQGLQVAQSRYTADLAIQRNWVLAGIRISAAFGPSLTLLQLKQAAHPDAERVTRWLVGARTGVYLTLARQRFSPFIGAHLQLLPYRIPIIVEPEGRIGDTSAFWFGASMGIALRTD